MSDINTPLPSSDSTDLARAVGQQMNQHDEMGRHLGITLVTIKPGYAQVSMTVREDMVNGFHICHGGVSYSLADTAFAYACNSRNIKTVAQSCHVSYIKQVQVGDTLTATAQEQTLSGRNGIYDVSVTNQNHETVLQFRGLSFGTSDTVV